MPLNADNLSHYPERITPQWVAGFFDGEGYICSGINKASDTVYLRMGITQKNVYVLTLIMMKYGGDLRTNKNGKGCFVIEWIGQKCTKILEDIEPFTIVKHELVQLGITLSKLYNNRGVHGSGRGLSSEEREERLGLMNRIKEINLFNKESVISNSSELKKEIN